MYKLTLHKLKRKEPPKGLSPLGRSLPLRLIGQLVKVFATTTAKAHTIGLAERAKSLMTGWVADHAIDTSNQAR